MKLKVLIIDDEEPARKLIGKFCEDYPALEIAGEYADGFNAVKAINFGLCLDLLLDFL